MNLHLDITIPSDLQKKLINFVEASNLDRWTAYDRDVSISSNDLTVIDRGRMATYVHLHDDIANEVNDFADQVFAHEQLEPNLCYPIPTGGITSSNQGVFYASHMISVIFKDKNKKKTIGIQRHIDPRNDQGWLHLRFNFMVQRSIGGEPVISSTVYDIKEGRGWICFASEWIHSALPVTGDKQRIILSLGYYVEPAYAREKYKHLF